MSISHNDGMVGLVGLGFLDRVHSILSRHSVDRDRADDTIVTVDMILAALKDRDLTSRQWHELDEAMLAAWRRLFEGSERFPVRL